MSLNTVKLFKLPNREWTITPNYNDLSYTVEYGIIDGEQQLAITKCKDVNDLNEKIWARVTKQIDINDYHYNLEQSCSRISPMLALDYTKVPHRLSFRNSVACQPKLDGLRLTYGKSHKHKKVDGFHSRGGKSRYHLEHLTEASANLLKEVRRMASCEALDGEVCKHDVSLQKINSAAQVTNDLTPQLEYHVFDLVILNMPFSERYAILWAAISNLADSDGLKLVPCDYIESEEQVIPQHNIYRASGYEGIMLRDANSDYVLGKRTPGLFKYKEFDHCQAVVLGIMTDKNGLDYYLARSLDTGVNFEVVPKLPAEDRENLSHMTGKEVTVKFQNLSDAGVPVFPVCVN